jgi:NAD+ diphosphatase
VARVHDEVTLPYNGMILDRAPASRTDPSWLEKIRDAPDSRTVVFWRDSCVVAGGRPVRVVPGGRAEVFLGRDGDQGVFAADLSELDEAAALAEVGGEATADIRTLFPTLPADESAILAYARGILHWHRNQRFCGACGGATESRDAGHLRVCAGCGKLLFPRIEPAVIVLVEEPDSGRCLLARHKGAAEGAYSTLAGFVEIGESLEDAVRRELFEEAGVLIESVRYQASQAWPFPAGLMIGFRAVAFSDEVEVDEHELVEARWFTRPEVRELLAATRPRTDSIEHFLVGTWLAEGKDTPGGDHALPRSHRRGPAAR